MPVNPLGIILTCYSSRGAPSLTAVLRSAIAINPLFYLLPRSHYSHPPPVDRDPTHGLLFPPPAVFPVPRCIVAGSSDRGVGVVAGGASKQLGSGVPRPVSPGTLGSIRQGALEGQRQPSPERFHLPRDQPCFLSGTNCHTVFLSPAFCEVLGYPMHEYAVVSTGGEG